MRRRLLPAPIGGFRNMAMGLKCFVVAALAALAAAVPLSRGQVPALDFLSRVPELRDLSTRMTERQLKAHIARHKLYSRLTNAQDGGKSYWVVTAEGENVFVGFDGEGCTGIQRMWPIPKERLPGAIGEPAFREWMARRKTGAAQAPKSREGAALQETGRP